MRTFRVPGQFLLVGFLLISAGSRDAHAANGAIVTKLKAAWATITGKRSPPKVSPSALTVTHEVAAPPPPTAPVGSSRVASWQLRRLNRPTVLKQGPSHKEVVKELVEVLQAEGAFVGNRRALGKSMRIEEMPATEDAGFNLPNAQMGARKVTFTLGSRRGEAVLFLNGWNDWEFSSVTTKDPKSGHTHTWDPYDNY
jgi:hypothetical protein